MDEIDEAMIHVEEALEYLRRVEGEDVRRAEDLLAMAYEALNLLEDE